MSEWLRGIAFLALTPALTARPAAAQDVRPTGNFEAERIDASRLPVTDRVTDGDGTTYLVVFERLVLSLRADRRFRASVRFRRTLYSSSARGRDRAAPMQTLSVAGSYEIVAGAIRFTPDSSSAQGGLRMLEGKVESSRRISVPFDYRNGAVERHRVLSLSRRDDIL